MLNIFSSKRHHPADIIQLCLNNYYCTADSCNSSSSSIKVSEFLLLAKTKKPIKEITCFAKNLSLFVDFPFTNSNLVTYLALYKEDQATHNSPHHYPLSSLSHSLVLKLHHLAAHIFKHFHTPPSLLQNLSS